MSARVLTKLLICGALAAVGVLGPVAIEHTPDNELTIRLLRALGAVGFIVGMVSLFRFTGAEAPEGDVVYQAAQPAPRTLESDPLNTDAETRPLEERLDAAIEASRSFSRAVGVIYYDLDAYRLIARSQGAAAADAAMAEVAAELKTRLRKTDRVERLGKGRLVVCAVLLADLQGLTAVRDRLHALLETRRYDGQDEDAAAFDHGAALYPMGGYTGVDLIACARRKCEEARAARLREIARARKAARQRAA